MKKNKLLTFAYLIDYQKIVDKVRRWSSGQEPREKKVAARVKGRVLPIDRTHDVLSRKGS